MAGRNVQGSALSIITAENGAIGAGLNVLTVFVQVDVSNVYAQALTPNTGTVHSFWAMALCATVNYYLPQETDHWFS